MVEKEMKTYSNIDDVERDLLPNYHFHQVIQKASDNPKYGEELANILFKNREML